MNQCPGLAGAIENRKGKELRLSRTGFQCFRLSHIASLVSVVSGLGSKHNFMSQHVFSTQEKPWPMAIAGDNVP